MSWLAASLLVLGLALVAGFAWYERSHPTARVLALVATLAALAALGRIAFAPIPNVKPTTDIVLLTGYALGGAPGFAVGAVAALASNVFFGQGPWTPWQMCAWGGVGVGGALLARAAGRELGRGALAAACARRRGGLRRRDEPAPVGDLLGDHSLAKLGAIFATSLPFDLAHVVGNVVFCLVFGPALVRALGRYRQRFEVTWLPAPALAATLLAALVLAAPRAARPTPRSRSASLSWLESRPERRRRLRRRPGQGSSAHLHELGRRSGSPPRGATRATSARGGADVVAYVRAHPPRRSGDLGDTTRTILLLRAAGLAPTARQPRPRARTARQAPRLGRVRQPREHDRVRDLRPARGRALAAATGRCARGARWIAGQANPDGGFNFAGRGGGSGIDDTGAALQGLVAAGRRGTRTVRRAARFLARRQNPDGGYPLQPGGPSNAQSTAWAVQALVAAGRNPDRQRRNGARSPVAYLRSLVTPGGAVRYSRTSAQTPVWVTAQALAALARKPFPLAPVAAPQGPRRGDPGADARADTPAAPRPRRRSRQKPTPTATPQGDFGPPTPPD